LSNGNVISRSDCTKLYRDSAGRTRQELTPNSSTCSANAQTIIIRDPVASVQYTIDTQNNTYREFMFRARPANTNAPPPNRPAPPNTAEVQTSNLGTQAIAATAFLAQGTQTVLTIPAGEIGNTQPIVITSITWYSPDLQIIVKSSHDDPRNGKTSYTLSTVAPGNQTDSLFLLPAGLTQQKGPGPGGHFRPGPQ